MEEKKKRERPKEKGQTRKAKRAKVGRKVRDGKPEVTACHGLKLQRVIP